MQVWTTLLTPPRQCPKTISDKQELLASKSEQLSRFTMTNNRSVIKLMRLYNELLAHSGPDEIKKSTFRCTTAAEYRFPTTRIASCLQLLLRALSQDVNSNLWCVLLVFWLRRRNKKSQGNEGIMQHPQPPPPTLSTPTSFEDIRGKRI